MIIYKVLVVDDEINILEGIATIVDWEGCQSTLSGKAYHGQMAFDMIINDPPDIVITDIKMPGLNGIELIEKVYKIHPQIKFIILSGHDEFEFAKTAMQYSVKHYLLKPSNKNKIEAALKEVILELEEENKKGRFIAGIREDFKKIIPIAKKQFLTEFIVNKSYGEREWGYYSQLFETDPIHKEVRLMIMMIDDSNDFEHLFALKEIMMEVIDGDILIHLSTTIGEKLVILLEDDLLEYITEKVKAAKGLFNEYYHINFTTTISNPAGIKHVQRLYKEAKDCLIQRFYLGNGCIITKDDIRKYKANMEGVTFNYDDIIFALRSGNEEQVQHQLNEFFNEIEQDQLEAGIVKSHCLEILMSIIRQAKREKIKTFLQQLTHFWEFETLDEIKMFVEKLAIEIARQNYDETRQIQHDIVQKIIRYLEENISDESLSLSYVADHVVFMNPDYLGRLFKKEADENFSTFLIRLRIEKAITIIQDSNFVKVFEVAKQVGFGTNPRYFGQVFKKHTGVTPTEYKNFHLQ